ncbi:MAG: hypothetical protein ACR2NL_02695, partial [Acidimicrobiia bacterium]
MMARRLPLALGTVVVSLFFAFAHATRLAPVPYPVLGTQRIVWTTFFVGIILVASYASGLPELPPNRFQALASAVGAAAAGLVGVSIAQLLLGAPLLPRVVLGGVALTFVPWALVCWNAESDRVRRSATNALFIGNPQEYAELAAEFAARPLPIVLAGRVNSTADISTSVRSHEAGMLIVDMASLADPEIVAEISTLHRRGVRVRTV